MSIIGTINSESLSGTPDDDQILGLGGNDTISAQAGNDTLDGGSGNDSLAGEGGDDTLVGDVGNDAIDGGADVDVAVFGGASAGYNLAFGSGVTVTDLAPGDGDEGVDTLTDVETLQFADVKIHVVGAGGFATIQEAIDAADPGDTILVADGVYNENVTITKSLTLLSVNGAEAVIIDGVQAGSELGAIAIAAGVNDVTIGGAGQGFTIKGIDGPAAVEKGAIYLIGAHNGVSILDNIIEARGDSGLTSEYGAAVSNVLIDGNEFTGTTFAGAQPGGDGFATQFSTPNVPRQLVVMGAGVGTTSTHHITFTNNVVSGTAGGVSTAPGAPEQGNTLVTIDAAYAVITDNLFTGFTNRGAADLRARGPNTTIENNTVDHTVNDSRSSGFFVNTNALPGGYANNVVIGGDGVNEVAVGTPGGDSLAGGDGDDTLFGRNVLANDTIDGGDTLDGGLGDDTLAGLAGADNLLGGQGEDRLDGGVGDDTLDGGADGDVLAGAAGVDSLLGGLGEDTLDGGAGADELAGGDGDDLYRADALDSIVEAENEGTDTVETTESVTLAANVENLTLLDAASRLEDFENFSLGPIADGENGWKYAGLSDQEIVLEGGDKALRMSSDPDTGSFGGPYSPSLTETAGEPSTTADRDSMQITFTVKAVSPDDNSRLEVDFGNEAGTDRNNFMVIESTVDGIRIAVSEPTTTNDVWTGGAFTAFTGNRELVAGLDNTVAHQVQLVLRYLDGPDNDVIDVYVDGDFVGRTSTFENYRDWLGGAHADNAEANQTSRIFFRNRAHGAPQDGPGDENQGFTFDDIHYSVFDSAGPSGVGNELANVITGNSGGNALSGLGGDDTIDGGIGDDSISGGLGNDSLSGGIGDDTVDGGDGDDFISATPGDDSLLGGADDDTLVSGEGNDTLDGGAGEDSLDAGEGDDIAVGGADADVIGGGAGADTLAGDAGADLIDGGAGEDSITGGLGDDTIDGGADADVATFAGDVGDYSFSISGGVLTVTDDNPVGGDEGVDTITNVARLEFADASALVVGAGGFATIQAAIDAAQAGDVIVVGPGTYNEQLVINKAVTLLAGGPGVILEGPLLDALGVPGNTPLNDFMEVNRPTGYSATTGVTISANDVVVDGFTITGFVNGIALGSSSGVAIVNNTFVDNIGGVRKSEAAVVSDLVLSDNSFSQGVYGVTIYAASSDAGSFDGVVMDNNEFSQLSEKGMYFEQLSNATLTGNVFEDVGNFGRITPTFGSNAQLGKFGNAIDINLKYETYENVSFIETVITNSGHSDQGGLAGADNFGGAIAVKARSDGSYAANPAEFTGQIVFQGGSIDGTSTGVRVGEPGANNLGPDVLVDGVLIANATVGDIDNATHPANGGVAEVEMAPTQTDLDASVSQAPVDITGNGLDNVIEGGSGADTLDGAAGNDSLLGGGGEDSLIGGAGNDTLDGGSGDDAMEGGADDDLYVVDAAGDVVTEAADEGTDTVETSAVATTLADNVEKLILVGPAVSGTGNALANVITGDSLDNTLAGGGGDDTIDGGDGVDVVEIAGARGDYAFSRDGADLVVTGGGETLRLQNVEAVAFLDQTVHFVGGDSDYASIQAALDAADAGDDVLVRPGAYYESHSYSGNSGLLLGLEFNKDDVSLIGVDADEQAITDRDDIAATITAGPNDINGGASFFVDSGADGVTIQGLGLVGGPISFYLPDEYINKVIEVWGDDFTLLDSDVIGDGGSALYFHDNTFDVGDYPTQNISAIQQYLVSGNHFVGDVVVSNGTGLGGDAADMVISGNLMDGGTVGYASIFLQGLDATRPWTNAPVLAPTITGNTFLANAYGALFSLDDAPGDRVDLAFVENFVATNTLPQYVYVVTPTDELRTVAPDYPAYIVETAFSYPDYYGAGDDYVVDYAEAGDTIRAWTSAATAATIVNDDVNIDVRAGSSLYTFTLDPAVTTLTLIGGEAVDVIGNGGDNVVTGNDGANSVSGLAGDDSLAGGGGDDTLDGGTDNDTLFGGGGNDSVIGASGADSLFGDGDADTLDGGAGDDSLDGGAGVDSLVGGADDDLYTVDEFADVVVEAGGGGDDTVASTAATYTLSAEVERLTLLGAGHIGGTGNTLANVILGNVGNNSIAGEGGDDTLIGDAGLDTALGGSGRDSVVGGAGDDSLYGGADNDTITGDGDNDRLFGDQGADSMLGGAGNDTLTGGLSANGSDGNDTLRGGAGNDSIFGGGDDDSIFGDADNDSLDGGNGNDSVAGGFGNDTLLGGFGSDTVRGDDGADQLFGGGSADTLDGGVGLDTLDGGAANDVYLLNDDFDVIVELAGGGDGDIARSALSTYTLADQVERLTLVGAAVSGVGNGLANLILGNVGANTLDGAGGADSIRGDAGGDSISGGSGNDSIRGQGDNDTIDGGGDNDTLLGDAGDDSVAGGDGANSLRGGEGADTLDGGAGHDTLVGEAGADVFVFRSATASAFGAGDVINGFVSGTDKIDLSESTALPLTYVGSGAFSAGNNVIEFRYNAVADRIEVDINDDGSFDAGDLEINGVTATPTLSDFIL